MKMAETIRIEIPVEVVDETSEGITQAVKGLDKFNKGLQQTTDKTTQYEKSAQKTQKTLASWAKQKYEVLLNAKDKVSPVLKNVKNWIKQKYEVLLSAKDKISPILKTIKNGLKSFGSKAWNITIKAIDKVTAPARGILNILKNPLFQAGAVLGVSFGIKDTIDTYKNFEAAMSKVQAVSGATSSELAKLTAKAEEMGSTTKFTAAQSAEAFNYMAMAGWKPEQMLDGIEGILNLAAASGEDLGTTSNIVTDAMTAFRMQANEATHFADVLARASSNSNTNVSEMGEVFKYVGAMAGTLGYSIEDVGIMIGLIANTGIHASQAGTELNSIFTRLATNTNGATDAINKLGIDFFDSSGKARKLTDVINELRLATADYTDKQKANIANTIAGTRAQAGLLAILNASEDDYNKLTEAIYSADGAAQQMADTMLDNLEGSIIKLQSALDGVKISFGKRLSPYVRGIAKWLTDLMPAIEDGLDRLMDWVDKKIEYMKRKFKEIADTKEWQNADFFGKVHILWDEFIAQPFSEWWNTTGKATFANIAKDIGKGIGSGLKFGLMTLLGIDISETIDEGVSIGASFTKGFSQGFDAGAVMDKLGEGLKNLFSNASKLLPGGESAGLSSLFSALLLGKIARPFIGLGKGVKSLFKVNPETGTSLMGDFLGSASTGKGLLGKSAAFGTKLSTFNLGKSIPMSASALSVSGIAAGAGAVTAGVTLLSSALDVYKSIKSDNKEEAQSYRDSAKSKVGGVGAGAIAGAALGTVIPGIGTAVGAFVGAGVGGIVGWIKGDKKKEEYQKHVEEAKKAQQIFEITGLSIDNTTFKSKKLRDAIKDSEVSAEQFAQMFQEECANVAQKAFGDITLSLAEVKKVASEITFGDMEEELNQFVKASDNTKTAFDNLQSSISTLKKENWKVSLGMRLSETDKDNYKAAIKKFIETSQKFIDDNHYEATVALKLLVGKEADTTGFDNYYSNLKSQIEDLGTQLTNSMNIALSDGVISLDEAAELENLQNQISDITNQLNEAKTDAQFQTLKVKYNGAALDINSFNALQEELQAYTATATEQYGEALTLTLTNLNLQMAEAKKNYTNGLISDEEFKQIQEDIQRQTDEATQGYYAQINDLSVRVSSFNLDSIATAFDTQLTGFMPEMEGTMIEKLTKVFNDVILMHPDVKEWNPDDVIRWFGLDTLRLDKIDQTTIAQELIQTAFAVPKETKEKLLEEYASQVPTVEEIKEKIDFTKFKWSDYEQLFGGSGIDQYMLTGDELNFEQLVDRFANNIHEYLSDEKNYEKVNDFVNTYMSEAMNAIDYSNIMEKPMSDEHYENAIGEWQKTGVALGNSLNQGASSSISGYSSILKTDLQTALNTATVTPFNISPTVNVTPSYNINGIPPSPSMSMFSAMGHATGGYVSGKQLSWVGEEGPEAIIPLVPGRRNRAISLYEEVGKILGVGAYAAGGIVGSSYVVKNMGDYHLLNEAIKDAPIGYNKVIEDSTEDSNSTTTPITQQSGNNNIEVHIQMSPEFVINHLNTQSEDEMMVIIRKGMMTMADELGGEIAQRIEAVFSNMPIVKEA